MNDTLLNSLSLSLYPMLDIKGKHYDGILFKKNQLCENCINKECFKTKYNKDYFLEKCNENLISFKITLHKKSFIVYGITNDYNKLSRNEKKYSKSKLYCKNLNSVKRWGKKVNENFILNKEENNEHEERSSIFIHDIKTIYSVLLRKVEIYIKNNSNTPNDLDKSLKNADNDLLSIYKTINLLEYQFNIIDFVSNPISATFGNSKRIHIYKTIDKLTRIFQSISDSPIKIIGKSFNKIYLYDSFVTLMFILIDNAIKYSHSDQEIEIHIEDIDEYNTIGIQVKSFSPYIAPGERNSIFDKYYRGESIRNKVSEGQGIGLFVAKIIADVLNTKIFIDCSDGINTIDNIKYCNVSFGFEITHID